ncbi:MAG: S-layer homology domain-containing protein [Clostridiales Family XIII bacterium]|jgi:acetyltransferase-like isoleucine patch superfamily enzyme|nr:S-layer homology domain-containing protein [Clostridiales Family XIII bacterium]
MKKTFARTLLAVMILTLALTSNAFAASPSEITDIPSGWSHDAVTAAVENGLLQGDNGKVDPKGQLSRTQLAAILVRAFGYQSKTGNLGSFTDVDASAWYYAELSAAAGSGLLQGDGATIRPNDAITRQEVAVVLTRAFSLQGGAALSAYTDRGAVASWASEAVAALVAAGYMKGYEDSTLRPLNDISREEFAQLMYHVVSEYITEPGEYTVNATGFVIIRAKGVTLKNSSAGGVIITQPGTTLDNSTIAGNVVLGSGVAAGDVTISDNTKIAGSVKTGDGLVVAIGNPETPLTALPDDVTPTTPAPGTTTGSGGSSGSAAATYSLNISATAATSGSASELRTVDASFYVVLGEVLRNSAAEPFRSLISNFVASSVADGLNGSTAVTLPEARNAAARLSDVANKGLFNINYSDGTFNVNLNVNVTLSGGTYTVNVSRYSANTSTITANAAGLTASAGLYSSVFAALDSAAPAGLGLSGSDYVSEIQTWFNGLPSLSGYVSNAAAQDKSVSVSAVGKGSTVTLNSGNGITVTITIS